MPGRLVQHGQALDLGDFEVGFGRAFGTPVESVSFVGAIEWAELLSLGLLRGDPLRRRGTFTPSPEEPSGSLESAAFRVWPNDPQLDTRPGFPNTCD